LIYKIVPASLWREAQENGFFTGAPADLADGFIHFSAADSAAGDRREMVFRPSDLCSSRSIP